MADIFDAQPTCGEISCDECNERYAKAVARIKALEDVVMELVDDDDCLILKVLRDKAIELLNQGGK